MSLLLVDTQPLGQRALSVNAEFPIKVKKTNRKYYAEYDNYSFDRAARPR